MRATSPCPFNPVKVEATKVGVTHIQPGPVGVPHSMEDGVRVDDGILRMDQLDRIPRALAQVSPLYPAEARRVGAAGEVLVEFTVGTTGKVVAARVVESSNHLFDAAAVQAVRKWRFEPGRKQGRAVRFSMVVPLVFRLGGE